MRGPLTTLVLLSTLLCMAGGCASTPSASRTDPRDFSACFYDFTDVYVKRIYGVLTQAPGASNVHRIWPETEDPDRSICYELIYDRPVEELETWLRKELPTSKVVPFRLESKGDSRLEVYFDGGFK